MKKIFMAWMAIGLPVLVGCAAAAGPGPVELGQSSKVELLYNSVFAFLPAYAAIPKNAEQELVSRFEAAHPNLEVTIGTPPRGGGRFSTSMMT